MFIVIHGYINYLRRLYKLQRYVPVNEMRTIMSSESEYIDTVMATFDTNISWHTQYVLKYI
jgi:hypothetical protein